MKMAEWQIVLGYLPYSNFYVEMYQIVTSYLPEQLYFSKMAGNSSTCVNVVRLRNTTISPEGEVGDRRVMQVRGCSHTIIHAC